MELVVEMTPDWDPTTLKRLGTPDHLMLDITFQTIVSSEQFNDDSFQIERNMIVRTVFFLI